MFYSNVHINDLDEVMQGLHWNIDGKKWVVGDPKKITTYSTFELIELGYKGIYKRSEEDGS